METGFVVVYLGIVWALSIYVTWHVARNVEYRNWAYKQRRCDQALVNSPWWASSGS